MPATADLEAALRGASLYVTRPRVALLDAIHEHPHIDTPALVGLVRERLGTVSTQAVYDGLHALTAAGLLRRLEPPGSPARYEARVGDDHHHLMCRTCGTIADVDGPAGPAPCLSAADEHPGFAVEATEVVYWGVCPGCAPQTPPPERIR